MFKCTQLNLAVLMRLLACWPFSKDWKAVPSRTHGHHLAFPTLGWERCLDEMGEVLSQTMQHILVNFLVQHTFQRL